MRLGQTCRVAASVKQRLKAASCGQPGTIRYWPRRDVLEDLRYHLRVTMRWKMPVHCSSSRSQLDSFLSCTEGRPIARSPPVEFCCCREACRIANRCADSPLHPPPGGSRLQRDLVPLPDHAPAILNQRAQWTRRGNRKAGWRAFLATPTSLGHLLRPL